MNEDQNALQNFDGVTRLFPLPNMVFFPHVVTPLHVFENRYRDMMADTLAGDKLLSLVLLRPGWESDYEGKPDIAPVACLGRVVADQQLPDGRYNLLLRGLRRIRILEEIESDNRYRSARVELLEDHTNAPLMTLMRLRTDLEKTILPRFHQGLLRDQLRELFRSELSLGMLTDVLTFALPVGVDVKQSILEELEIETRAQLLLNGFSELSGQNVVTAIKPKKYPPDFSVN